jgi:hypothetical protein
MILSDGLNAFRIASRKTKVENSVTQCINGGIFVKHTKLFASMSGMLCGSTAKPESVKQALVIQPLFLYNIDAGRSSV